MLADHSLSNFVLDIGKIWMFEVNYYYFLPIEWTLLTKDKLSFFYKWKGYFEIASRIVSVKRKCITAHWGVRSQVNESGSRLNFDAEAMHDLGESTNGGIRQTYLILNSLTRENWAKSFCHGTGGRKALIDIRLLNRK